MRFSRHGFIASCGDVRGSCDRARVPSVSWVGDGSAKGRRASARCSIVLRVTRERYQGSRRCCRGGLTFVELLLAVTMVAILFVGLGTHLRGGIVVWQRVTQSTQARQGVRMAIERMNRDLTGAFIFDDHPEAYATQTEWALAPAELNNDSIAVYTAASRQWDEPSSVRRVSYWCGRVGEQTGLWRSSWSVAQVRAKKGPDPELILADCEGLSLKYAYLRSDDPDRQSEPVEWHTAWQETPKFLPRLIDVTLTVAGRPSPQGSAAARRTLETIMMVPVGVLKAPPQ